MRRTVTCQPYNKHRQWQRTCTVSPHKHCMPHAWSRELSGGFSGNSFECMVLKNTHFILGFVFEHKLFKFLDIWSKAGGVDRFV